MVFLSQVLPLVLGFFLAMQGHHISVASLVAMYIAAGQLVGPIKISCMMWLKSQGAKTTAEKIFGILNRADDSESDNHSISQVEELEISHLSKSYNGREILRDLNLAIRQGEKSSSKGQVAVGNQPSSE